MPFDDVVGDGESKPDTFCLPTGKERFENSFEIVGVNPFPRIGESKKHTRPSPRFRPHRDREVSTVRHGIDRIHHNVETDLLKMRTRGFNQRQIRGNHFSYVNVLLGQVRFQESHAVVDECGKITGMEFERPRSKLAEVRL